MYLLIQTVAFEVDLFCFSFISFSSGISNMATVSDNEVGVFTGTVFYALVSKRGDVPNMVISVSRCKF